MNSYNWKERYSKNSSSFLDRFKGVHIISMTITQDIATDGMRTTVEFIDEKGEHGTAEDIVINNKDYMELSRFCEEHYGYQRGNRFGGEPPW